MRKARRLVVALAVPALVAAGGFTAALSLAHGLLCLTDPGYSKTNGTQLIVYTCHNTSNQRWSA